MVIVLPREDVSKDMGKMKAVKNLLLKFPTGKLRSLQVLYSKDPEGQFVGAE